VACRTIASVFRRGVQLAVVGVLALPGPAHAARAVLHDRPAAETTERVATFTFDATPGALFPSFECRQDSGPWETCASPRRLVEVTGGSHRFEVRLQGILADPTPDAWSWTVTIPTVELPCGSAAGCNPAPGVVPGKPAAPPRSSKRRDAHGCAYGANRVDEASSLRLVRATVCLINHERRTRGLPVVRTDARLSRASRLHATDMVARRYFSHVSPTGIRVAARVARTGYLRGRGAWALGEILAWSATPPATPALIVNAWMHSPKHRHVLLGPSYRDVGVGIATGGPGRPQRARAGTYAAVFGRRG
jgi:uncharacterized protein YkwD